MSVDKEGFIPRYLYENVEGNYYDVSTEVALLHQLLEEAIEFLDEPDLVWDEKIKKWVNDDDLIRWLDQAKNLTQ